ncbi:hypothetical protein D3C74_218580 [compost metagenome]
MGDAVRRQAVAPLLRRAPTRPLAPRPAADVHHRRVEVQRRDAIRVQRGVPQRVQATPAEAEQHRLQGEPVFRGHLAAKGFHLPGSVRAAVKMAQPAIGEMPALLEQGEVGVRERAEELAPPHPRPTRRGILRSDHHAFAAAEVKVGARKAHPFAHLSTLRAALLQGGPLDRRQQRLSLQQRLRERRRLHLVRVRMPDMLPPCRIQHGSALADEPDERAVSAIRPIWHPLQLQMEHTAQNRPSDHPMPVFVRVDAIAVAIAGVRLPPSANQFAKRTAEIHDRQPFGLAVLAHPVPITVQDGVIIDERTLKRVVVHSSRQCLPAG